MDSKESLFYSRDDPDDELFLPLTAMSSVAGRKKSIVGANGIPAIDIPQQNLLNKAASQSTSLYQDCSQLRARLMRIRDFPPFLDLAIPQDDVRKSTDMVHDLWDHLALGVPLVFLFNLLPPPATPIENIDTNPDNIALDDISWKKEKDRKRPIAFFIMAITRLEKAGHWQPNLNFTIHDLLENNTNGFVKVRILTCSLLFVLMVTPGRPNAHALGGDSTPRRLFGTPAPVLTALQRLSVFLSFFTV